MSEERTSKFLSAIERYAKEQQKALKTKFKEIRKNELQLAEAEVLRDSYYLIQEEMVKMHKKIDGEIARKEIENRKRLIKRREEIKKCVFAKAKEKLIKITNDDTKYLEILKNSLQKMAKVLTYSGTVIYVKDEDLKFCEDIKSFYPHPVSVKTSKDIEIGGLIGSNQRMGIVVNETLDEKLLAQEDWFIRNAGIKVL